VKYWKHRDGTDEERERGAKLQSLRLDFISGVLFVFKQRVCVHGFSASLTKLGLLAREKFHAPSKRRLITYYSRPRLLNGLCGTFYLALMDLCFGIIWLRQIQWTVVLFFFFFFFPLSGTPFAHDHVHKERKDYITPASERYNSA
jgi:hypothetical protein